MKSIFDNYKVSLILISIFILLGFGITLQFKNTKQDYSFITLKTMNDLHNSLIKEKEEIKNLQDLIELKKKNLLEYETAIKQEGSIVEVVKNEIISTKAITGFYDVEGPGIIVKLNDSERDLQDWEDPNDLIIHEQDVLSIINDLKIAGAEVLSINGQRILNTSEIKCAGPTITVNGYTYGQPFIIKAIGDPATLDAAIKSPDSYSAFLRDVFGLVVESQVNPRIRISRFQREINLKYVTPREGD